METRSSRFRLDKEAIFADLGYVPHAGQLEVHRSKALRRVLACGVRWGKSTCAAMEAIAAALEPREASLGWFVGPTYACRRGRAGESHPYLRPLDAQARAVIERQVFEALGLDGRAA